MFDAEELAAMLLTHGVSDVVWLPDSVLGRWESILAARLPLWRVCREGEAWLLAAGLWIGGKRPMVLLQNTGLFESGDALRNAVFDLQVPLYALVGYRGLLTPGTPDTAARFTEPILQAWGLDHLLLRTAEDLSRLGEHYACCQAASRAGLALVAEGVG